MSSPVCTLNAQTMKVNFKINKGVVWLKVGYSLWAMATNIVMPFIALQMSNKGLSDGDISLILGVMPFTLVPIMPFIGMLGDKFGYKYIISTNCLLIGVAMTAFHYVPNFHQGNLKYPSFNLTEDQELFSIQWPICNGTETCEDSRPIADNETFLEELVYYISDELNITDLVTPQHLEYNQTIEMENGTFCLLTNSSDEDLLNTTSYIFKDILDTCDPNYGSARITFWTMMLLLFSYRINLSSGFGTFDGVSQLQAAKHHSKYNYILFYTIAAQAISPLFSSWTITDNADGTSDYLPMYLVSDGILFLAFIACMFFVDFEATDKEIEDLKASPEPLVKALPKLFSLPFLVLMFGIFVSGLQWGIHDSFLFLYLKEDLNADSDLLSYMSIIGMTSMALLLPFAGKLTKLVGTPNAILIQLLVESARFLIYSWVKQSPPYYALGLHALDFTMWSFSWVATMNYGYLITPPTIASTMSATLSITEFTVAKSIGVLIGGQLRSIMTRPELFRWTAFVTTGLGLVYYLLYFLIARKQEKKLVEQLNAKYPQRFKKTREVNLYYPEEDIFLGTKL